MFKLVTYIPHAVATGGISEGDYRTLPASDNEDYNIMAELCNEFGLYEEECPALPDPQVEKLLNVKLQDSLDDFIEEVLKKMIPSQSQSWAGALPCAIL